MPATELEFWRIKYQEEYLGADRLDYNAAKICAYLGHFMVGDKRPTRDYMPQWGRAETAPNAEADPKEESRRIAMMFECLAVAGGRKFLRK